MSGGIDSSSAYYVKEIMGLKPLVFHVDAGWILKNLLTIFKDRGWFQLDYIQR